MTLAGLAPSWRGAGSGGRRENTEMAQSLKSQGPFIETHLHTSIDTEDHFYLYPELTLNFNILSKNFLVFKAT